MTTTLDKFFADKDVEIIYVQTTFEGYTVNTLDRAKREKARWKVTRPVGHDIGDGKRPHTMKDFRAGATPWTAIIGKDGTVRFNDVTRDFVSTKRLIEGLVAE